MGLIKEINDALEQQLQKQAEYVNEMKEKFNVILETKYHGELIETAEHFLNQVATMIKSGEKLNLDQAKILGAKLASLELIADPGTRGAALSVISGSDSKKKITTIMKQTSGTDESLGQVDKVLIALANRVGKSGVERNIRMLTNLEGMDDKTRAAKAMELISLADKFRDLEAKIQTFPAPSTMEPVAA